MLMQVVIQVDKYFHGDYSQFHVESKDGTLDETISINKSLIADVKDFVEFLKVAYGDELADKMFEVFIEFALMHSLCILNNRRDLIIELSGDSNGN